ncbi:L,D-transpeptidase [candidate division WOR-3 bacterium]|nr:L,D-transpeptidase [candidate division WOR-3 bacterium]
MALTVLFLLFKVVNAEVDVPRGVRDRMRTIVNSVMTHCERGELSWDGYIFYIDPSEYIPADSTYPRLGTSRGDDEGISVQRLVWGIDYEIKGEEVHYAVESFFPVRTGRLGFGFEKRSGRTPTGFYVLGDYYLAEQKYTNLSINYPGEITTGRILLLNVMKNGHSIYTETRGQNNPLLRGILIHGFGLSEQQERNEDEGSKGCVHVTAEGIISIINILKTNRGRTYIFISGADTNFSDLPQYEKSILEQ